jgi:uncharacterized protein
MQHKHTILTLALFLWITLGDALPGNALADSFDDVNSALSEGDYRAAYRGFKRLAQRDHPQAQYQLGMLYLSAKGVEMDVAEGVEWLKRAANGGVYLAANELAQIYLSGRGVAPDEQEAMKWVELATKLAEQNSGEADDGCE